jgi:hypothetical protein
MNSVHFDVVLLLRVVLLLHFVLLLCVLLDRALTIGAQLCTGEYIIATRSIGKEDDVDDVTIPPLGRSTVRAKILLAGYFIRPGSSAGSCEVMICSIHFDPLICLYAGDNVQPY